MPLPIVAIPIGDPAGIGPEISIKAALDPAVRAICRPLLVGDRGVLEQHARACGIDAKFATVAAARDADFPGDAIALLERTQFVPGSLRLGEVAAENGRAALDSAEVAIRAALAGDVHAVVAAPHNETAIAAAGIAFDGYPGFVARTAGIPEDEVLLMLCFEHAGTEIRIAHATLHTGVAQALALLTRERIARALRATDATLRRMGIARPRIAASGVNPHAGEGGLFGSEEIEIIAPALDDARGAGVEVDGPFGADTLLQRPGYDAFVVMLHDQGHVAAKLLAPNRAAGLAIGAPLLFSSVGHGSAFDIAGRGRADHAAMAAAIARLVGVPR